eukprot:GFYU01002227.1.p1 GENE.GFYU01002227.1~~GFYU01002227.1.p1  ORF type:complete len:311 (+),score=91.73 GFYU01002227.1:65-934(+)
MTQTVEPMAVSPALGVIPTKEVDIVTDNTVMKDAKNLSNDDITSLASHNTTTDEELMSLREELEKEKAARAKAEAEVKELKLQLETVQRSSVGDLDMSVASDLSIRTSTSSIGGSRKWFRRSSQKALSKEFSQMLEAVDEQKAVIGRLSEELETAELEAKVHKEALMESQKVYQQEIRDLKFALEQEKAANEQRMSPINGGKSTPYKGTKVSQKPVWIADEMRHFCRGCNLDFNVFKRRHHCRACGDIFCHDCSSDFHSLPHYGYMTPVRCCDNCTRIIHLTPSTSTSE